MAETLDRFNRRMLVKRSTVAGVVPTIPATPPAEDLLDHTQGGWLDTDLYVGELFINVVDQKMWFRSNVGLKEVSLI